MYAIDIFRLLKDKILNTRITEELAFLVRDFFADEPGHGLQTLNPLVGDIACQRREKFRKKHPKLKTILSKFR